MEKLRPDLPPLPDRLKQAPIDRGFPVPWFVPWLDEDENELPRGQGKPEFRLMAERRIMEAIRFKKCWVCGEPIGKYKTFTVGPMCVVNRISAEPPSHRECAIFAATACPFLSRPDSRRRETNMPALTKEPPGIAVQRNPGVTCVWTTLGLKVFRAPNKGVLFKFDDPTEVLWYAEGREATRAECEESIKTGLPALTEIAEENKNEKEMAEILEATERAKKYLPTA